MRVIMLAAALSVALAGCAKKSEDVLAQYQPPSKFKHLTCDEISSEMERVSSSVVQLADAQDSARTRDQIATGVGIVLFWPALFLLAAGDEQHELSRMKGEYDALTAAYGQKRCETAPALAVSLSGSSRTDSTAPAMYTPVPGGAPEPFEGVLLASYTASDMRWFCGQPWRERRSPSGRTEYNPCHVPEMFR